MCNRRITDAEFVSLLIDSLSKFPNLSKIAPSDWTKKAKITLSKMSAFSRDRQGIFNVNLPLALFKSSDQEQDVVAREVCKGMVRKYDGFLAKNSSMDNAVDKVREVFNADWDLKESRFMSTLSELCLIELLGLKSNMKLVGFDAPLSLGMKGQQPANADIKLRLDNRDVFVDVKSPVLMDCNLDAKKFRINFEKFSEKDFNEKFRLHTTTGVHRVISYIYKFSDA